MSHIVHCILNGFPLNEQLRLTDEHSKAPVSQDALITALLSPVLHPAVCMFSIFSPPLGSRSRQSSSRGAGLLYNPMQSHFQIKNYAPRLQPGRFHPRHSSAFQQLLSLSHSDSYLPPHKNHSGEFGAAIMKWHKLQPYCIFKITHNSRDQIERRTAKEPLRNWPILLFVFVLFFSGQAEAESLQRCNERHYF